jgi:hypothetical protein
MRRTSVLIGTFHESLSLPWLALRGDFTEAPASPGGVGSAGRICETALGRAASRWDTDS